MERLALIGTSQRRQGTKALEAWTAWLQQAWPSPQVPEGVPLLTCNRAELVLALPPGLSLETLRQELLPPGLPRGYAFVGEAALEHLCRVAASLDSLNPGEDQIMQQVRQAFEEARQKGTVGPLTSFAFQQALRTAKRVRREVPLAPAQTSLFSLARPELEARLPTPARVAVLGVGQMGRLAAVSLAENPQIRLLLVNRNLGKAQALAAELGAEAMELEAFLKAPPPLDGLVAATPVEHLIGPAFLQGQPGLRVVVDLGLPQNVAPLEGHPAHLLNLEALRRLGEARRARLQAHLAQAERIIAEELEKALAAWAERAIAPAIQSLRAAYRRTLEEAVGELLEPELLERLAHRFAHFPVKGLRGLARKHGAGAALDFLQAAGLEGPHA